MTIIVFSVSRSWWTISYWDWSKNNHHWWSGTANDGLWNPGDHGLGGDGSKNDDNCAENGPFSKDKWRLHYLCRLLFVGFIQRNRWYNEKSSDSTKRFLAGKANLKVSHLGTVRVYLNYVESSKYFCMLTFSALAGTTKASQPDVDRFCKTLAIQFIKWG